MSDISSGVKRRGGVTLLLLYLAAVFVTGAALAPWLFKLGRWYAEMIFSFKMERSWLIGDLAEKCRDSQFDRYFNRSMVAAALVWLWPFARWAGVTRADMGLQPNRFRWQDALVGFILGSSVLLLLGAMLFAQGLYRTQPGASVGGVLTGAAISAVCVALFEEFFFRGALFGLLRRTLAPLVALLALSVFFSIVHLLQYGGDLKLADNEVQIGTGFWVAGQILAQFADAHFMLAIFSTLFLLGLILGWARLRTQSLWLAIGLHAGLVFGVKLFSGLARGTPRLGRGEYMPWIGKDLRIGLAPLAALAVIGLIMFGWLALRAKAMKFLASTASSKPPAPPGNSETV